MIFSVPLPNGMSKAAWIASLPKGTHFCTRRAIKCKNCGKDSTEHAKAQYSGDLICIREVVGKEHRMAYGAGYWTPNLSRWKVGSMRDICPKMMKPALCECGCIKQKHEQGTLWKPCQYRPLRCKIVSVMEESDWKELTLRPTMTGTRILSQEDMLKEAKLEGFDTWEQLQAALKKCYPKGIPLLARVEMIR